ncbi:MAG: hypothetical protein SPL39_01050 [Selenomonadaceae bacterium]|nr:hypothetical protein [Selenomonadaceae bacterium]
MDADDLFNLLVVIAFVLLPLLDRKKEKGKGKIKGKAKAIRLPKSLSDELSNVLSKKFPTQEEVRKAEDILRHRGELLPNETMWQPDVEEMPQTAQPVDDMMVDEAEAELRDMTHTAAYETKRRAEEAATRAAEQAAYERAAKLPSRAVTPQPRIEMTAEKAREAIVLATILGAPKAKQNGWGRFHVKK